MLRRTVALILLPIAMTMAVPLSLSGDLVARGTVYGSAIALAGPCGAAPKIGSSCSTSDEAAADVELLIWSLDKASKINYVRTSANGTFRVKLLPGSYEVRLAKTASPWMLEPLRFSLHAGDRINLVVRLHLLRG